MTSKKEKMNYILFDGDVRNALLPFTYTRPVADIRVGILTIREKWEKYLNGEMSIQSRRNLTDLVHIPINKFRNSSRIFNSTISALTRNIKRPFRETKVAL